jgi:hypothetical protein
MESAQLTQSNNHLWEKILIVILFYLVIAFVSNELILTEEMYFDFYDGQIEADKVDSVIHKTRGSNIITTKN